MAGVGLVCGMIGAMGYVHFFGPKSKEFSSDQSQAKGKSGSKKKSGSGEKPRRGESQKLVDASNAQALTTTSVPGVASSKGADVFKQQIKDLSQRVDRLRERVDNVTRPTDETSRWRCERCRSR